MENLTTRTVRDIAIEMPQTTRVFESFKIDYCCGGRKNFLDACQNVGADPDKVLSEIENVLNAKSGSEEDRLTNGSLTDLADHILDKHHVFTHYEIRNLPPLMDKVAKVHGEHHPELLEIRDLLSAIVADLSMHMYKEENILFPYIKDMDRAVTRNFSILMPPFGTVQHPVRMMMTEHDTVGDLLKQIRQRSNDYALPEGACPSYSGLFNRLEAFEFDLHEHIHLENNILFPRAIELEGSAFQSGS